MRLDVKCYGDLKRYAPNNRTSFTLTLTPGTTLGNLLAMLAIPEGSYVPLINGRRVDRTACFEAGDTLVLLPPTSGG